MATITKRVGRGGAVSYRVRVRVLGRSVSETFGRLTDARTWGAKMEAAIGEGRHFPERAASRRTLAELVERYTRDVLPKKKDGAKQARQLAEWVERMGSRALLDVTPDAIVAVRDELQREGRSGATVNRYLAALSHAFTVAVKEWSWMTDNPCRRVSRAKESRGVVRFLSDDERERLLAACAEGPNFLLPAVLLALGTAMRAGEIAGLRWADIDLERGWLVLHATKNGERRGVRLSRPVVDAMRRYQAELRLDEDRVFPTLRRAWEAAVERAGISKFRFHDLRHTAASYLAMLGASPSEIAEVTGHKTLVMVKRYAHLSDAHTAGVVDRMAERFLGGGKAKGRPRGRAA